MADRVYAICSISFLPFLLVCTFPTLEWDIMSPILLSTSLPLMMARARLTG